MEANTLRDRKNKINIVLHDNTRTQTEGKQQNLYNVKALQLIDKKLKDFIGLDNMKAIIKEIYAHKLMNQKRSALGLATNNQVLHMIFKGNPGTGKTTIARQLSILLYHLNVLSKGHFIEIERADIVGEYIGQTAQKTRTIVQKALGGILFIDEAYALIRGGHKDFGREAIDTLVKQMEDHCDDFMLILAGYPREMEQFLSVNPGLKSRFPFHIHFKNYSVDELVHIAQQTAQKKEYELSKAAVKKIRFHLQTELQKDKRHFANGRYIRNIIEKSIRMQAMRLLPCDKLDMNQLMLLQAEDISFN